jgi:hypothetical protein
MSTFISLRGITTDLLSVIRGSNVSQSETISLRQLETWVDQYRALLLKRDLDKGKFPNPDYIQEIDYLQLDIVDAAGSNLSSSNVLNLSSGEYILKSKLPLPNTIDLNFKSGFMYIGTVVGDELQFVPEGRSKWQKFKKYTMNDSICFLKNNYLYVLNNERLNYITVRGVFEVPSEVGRFVNPITNQPYFNIDTKYPIPINMIPELKQMILKGELGITVQAPSDTKNDGENEVSPNVEGNQQRR